LLGGGGILLYLIIIVVHPFTGRCSKILRTAVIKTIFDSILFQDDVPKTFDLECKKALQLF
jgi:hypothetical protein